jgi:hypothetical protein
MWHGGRKNLVARWSVDIIENKKTWLLIKALEKLKATMQPFYEGQNWLKLPSKDEEKSDRRDLLETWRETATETCVVSTYLNGVPYPRPAGERKQPAREFTRLSDGSGKLI